MAFKIDVLDINGKKKQQKKTLAEDIFNEKNINNSLIHEFILMQRANARIPYAHVKKRDEVASTGKKLIRQKGTGNARVGDAGSPTRRHGGKSFGPRNTVNFTKDMPKKKRRKALFGALSLKAKEKQLYCISDFPYEEAKTKNAENLLKAIRQNDNNTVLVVVDNEQEIAKKSFRNLEGVKYVVKDYLNPFDLLTHKVVLFFKSSLEGFEKKFSS